MHGLEILRESSNHNVLMISVTVLNIQKQKQPKNGYTCSTGSNFPCPQVMLAREAGRQVLPTKILRVVSHNDSCL